MVLDGAMKLSETDNYIIYAMNNANTGQYAVVVPKNINDTLKMLIDLRMKSVFGKVNNGTMSRDLLVSEIGEEYNKLKGKYSDGMLVMPMLDEDVLSNIIVSNDKQKMFDEVKKIGAITSELYKKLTDIGIDKQKIDQKIIIIEKTSEDEKFVSWLKEQMPNFVDGVLYSELSGSVVNDNPFMNNNSIFDNVVESKPVEANVSSSIFDNVSSVTSNVPVQENVPVSSGVSNVEPANVDIFGISNDVKGVDNTNSVREVLPVNPLENSSSVDTAPVVPDIKPVQSTELEKTSVFDSVLSSTSNDVSNVDSNSEVEGNNGSKGFVNLIILVIILVVVTVVSIEFGKYLYSVYGA